MSLLASTKSRSPWRQEEEEMCITWACGSRDIFPDMTELIQSLFWVCFFSCIFMESWIMLYQKADSSKYGLWSVLLNSTHTEFGGVVLSESIWLLLVTVWSCLLLLSFRSFSILCFVALLELRNSSQSRTIYFKCKTRPTSGAVQLRWPVCVPTEVGGKMPADGRAAPSCLLLVPQTSKGTEIEKFKHERLLYAQMSMSGSHRDYWERNISSEEQNLTHGDFPTHKCGSALQRLPKSWSISQSLCWKPWCSAAFWVAAVNKLPRVLWIWYDWGR